MTKTRHDDYADRRYDDTHMDNGHKNRTNHESERTTRSRKLGPNKKKGSITCDHPCRQRAVMRTVVVQENG